jgi:hypothetical protein
MSAFTLVRAKPLSASQIHSGLPAPPVSLHEMNRAKRNRTYHSSLSGKRFDATEDRSHDRPACAVQPVTEVMHPKSISRELAQENEDRPGIA